MNTASVKKRQLDGQIICVILLRNSCRNGMDKPIVTVVIKADWKTAQSAFLCINKTKLKIIIDF